MHVDRHSKEREKLWRELDRERREAMTSDYMKYAVYNRYFGITPEMDEENQQGLAAIEQDPKRAKEIEDDILERFHGNQKSARHNKPARKQTKKTEPMRDDLEEKLTEESLWIRKENHEDYGIREDMFRKLPYSTVKDIFFGIQNFDCPEMYRFMNPTEILGLWAGIGRKEAKFHSCIRPNALIDTLSELVQTGYKSSIESVKRKNETSLPHLASLKDKGIDQYSNASNHMKTRLSTIDDKTMRKIYSLLAAPKRYTENERNTCRGEPGFDASNLIYDPFPRKVNEPSTSENTQNNKMIYAMITMNLIDASYRNHVKRNNRNPLNQR